MQQIIAPPLSISPFYWFFGNGIALLLMPLFFLACTEGPGLETASEQTEANWYKGNLHTHTLWSDGDDYPEMVIRWYRDHGYHFLALSDHNILSEGERWIPIAHNSGGQAAFERYKATFGAGWVEERVLRDTAWVRLKTFDEYRRLFEVADSFLMIRSEEITDGFNGKPIHVNATNIREYIAPQGGESVRDVMQRNVDAVLAQRDSLDVPMFPHINHPNFGWAVTAEDLAALEGEQFFEVYNGHPLVRNYGVAPRPGMERMWDIILTRRLLHGRPLMYGIAVDDSHHYHEIGTFKSNTGRAWVMVRAPALSAEAIINAMEAGSFYGSTGITLQELVVDAEGISLTIDAASGVSYQTAFIGTEVAHDTTSSAQSVDGEVISRRYSDSVGKTLAIVDGASASYTFTGDELYVRARITSTKPKENPYQAGETEMAWIQPVVVK
ncbi:MAG: histidinol-phosphatase [Bacteroidota bacterium]